MNQTNPLKRKILLAAAGILLVMGLIAVALRLDLVTSPKAAASGPLKIVTFADGGKLEIFGVSVGERVVEVSPPKWFFLRFFSGIKGSGSGTWGGLNVDSESEGGKIIRLKLHSDSRAAMLMEFRMVESDGREMKIPSYLARNGVVWPDARIAGKSGSPHSFELKDDSVESVRAELAKTGLQVLIQQRDSLSGWINFMGPSMYHEPWPGRYIVALTAWQRSLPTLECRAIRADGQVAEFSLENPDFRKKPAPGAVKPLPFVHTAGDFELTVKQVRRFATPGDHPFAAVEMELRYKGAPVPGLKDGPINFDGATNGAEDEWGNVVDFERDTIRKKTSFGAFLPGQSERMTLDLSISRTDNYPRSVHAGFVVLEGVVSADGLSVDFTPGPDAALFGIRTMPAGKITPKVAGSGKDPTIGWKQLVFEISGEGGDKEQVSIQSRIGEIQRLKILVFPESSNESAGFPDSRAGGGGGGGGQFNFNRRYGWSAPPELLKPGAKIRVGIQGPLKNENVRFTLELPELIQPR